MDELQRLEETGHTFKRRAPLRSVVRRVVSVDRRYRIHQALVESRRFAERYVNLDPAMAISRVTPATQLVMDGFGRSANTYALGAFLEANGYDTPTSTHRHSPALIEHGVRLGLPTIVLIRRPRPAIASGLQYTPEIRPKSAIDAYRRYYTRVVPLLDTVVVATFDQVVDDFGEVTRRCNERFGTSFVPYVKTPEGEAAIQQTIRAAAADVAAPGQVAHMVPLPSDIRRSADEVLGSLSGPLVRDLDRLDALFDEIAAAAR